MLPDGDYLPARAPTVSPPNMVVTFHGEDGRAKDFDVSTLPLPGWHPAPAAAFAERVGPSGTIRTVASAQSVWSMLLRFMRFLAALPEPPATVSALTVKHLESFREHRIGRIGDPAWMEFRSIALLMRIKSSAICLLLRCAITCLGVRINGVCDRSRATPTAN